ncbi:MAG TPA: hypothetical protein VGH79_08195 [Gaiellaceae bacterium]|jgi:hypothetical protein
MVQRRRLILALFGTLAFLAFPSSSLALDAAVVYLTPSGPSPATLTMTAGMYPVWMNQDTVAHTVTFASGCSIEVEPGDVGQCSNDLGYIVGDFPYTVDGTTQASVSVLPAGRTVTIRVKRHGFRLGSKVRLHGRLALASLSPPQLFGPRMPVTVFARPHGGHVWHRIAAVMAKPLKKGHYPAHSVWHIWVRPRAGTTYIARAESQPRAGQHWENAQSKPCGLYVRHHRH